MNSISVALIQFAAGRICAFRLLGVTLISLLACGSTFAQSIPASRALSQTPSQVLNGKATLAQHYDSSKMLRLTIALKLPHLDQERQLLDQLHDKKSPQFHKFLTPEQWDARFAPSAEDEQAIVSWAQSRGLTITHRYADRLLVDVEAPAGIIEKALNVAINNYQMGAQTYFSNDRDPEIPSALTSTVQAVLGLNSFLQMRPAISGTHTQTISRPDYVAGPVVGAPKSQQGNGSAEKLKQAMQQSRTRVSAGGPHITNGGYDPSDIYSSQAYDYNALYNLGHCCNPQDSSTGSPPEASIAIASYGDVNFADIVSFHDQYPYLAWNLTKVSIDGGYTCQNAPGNPDDNCVEVTLDTEWSLSMSNSFGAANNTAHIWIYEGANFGDIADLYNQMVSDGHARVTTTSWGCEEFACFNGPTMSALDGIFAKMVGQGWTLIAASGDNGAADGCGDADAVDFPSTDPNFIAAGGTSLSLGEGPVYESEYAWSGLFYSGACSRNNGGSTGGFSAYFNQANGLFPSYQGFLGFSSRAVPDISLNADPAHGQNVYDVAAGGLVAYGGTSIVAPELAGFFAQENAYGLSVGNVCGSSGTATCAPIGNANYYIYEEAQFKTAAHYPYYGITSGCNSNDVTAEFDLGYYCAAPGFNEVTGWGSANLLQLAWAINWYDAKANGGPSISFGGPAINTWFNTDQLVDWDVVDNVGSAGGSPTGIAGFTQGWDSIPNDSYSNATPGAGDSFYSGPQHVNATFGCTDLSGALCSGGVSQGCHTVYVQAWNNMGVSSGVQSYGPICYDTIAPITTLAFSGTLNGALYISPVTFRLTATDSGSGVKAIYYQLDSGPSTGYSASFTVGTTGAHALTYYSVDVAGNKSTVGHTSFVINSPTSTKLSADVGSTTYGGSVTLTATVAANFGGVPAGTVTFRDGAAALGTVALSGGTAALHTTALNLGSNSLTAVYNGSGNDEPSTSAALIEKVSQASSSTSIASSLNPSSYDAAVTFTATVTSSSGGVPSGTVTFKQGTTTVGAAVLAAGKAAFKDTTLAFGNQSITAVYGGNADYIGSTSPPLTQTVSKAATTTTIVSSPDPSTFDKPVALTATVKSTTAGTPTGTVTFKQGATILASVALVSGKATFTDAALASGSDSITATYGGNGDYVGSTSAPLTQIVDKATTTISVVSSLNPSAFDKSIAFSATVKSTTAGTPSGTVTFYNGPTALGTVALTAGAAIFRTTSLTVGGHSISAKYSGSTDYAASTSAAILETVEAAVTTTTLTSSLNPSTRGKAVTFTALVASAGGVPTGSVSFMDGTTKMGSGILSGGKVVFATNALAAGTDSIKAVYAGAMDFATSSSAVLSEKVNP